MNHVEAIFQGGVFRPLGPVPLPENQRVRLAVHPEKTVDVQAWLEEVQHFQKQMIAKGGCFPDSAAEIAADRARDE